MTTYLLALRIGPAQAFIARARRLRDLWFGSFLLSDISKAVARHLNDAKHELIIPAAQSAEALRTLLSAPEPAQVHRSFLWEDLPSVVNVVLAEVKTDNPKTVAEAAKRAAQARLSGWAGSALESVQALVQSPEAWDEQIAEALEVQAAWVPLDPGRYQACRQRVMALLDAAQQLNSFSPQMRDDAGLPKSSLDGLRPSVMLGDADAVVKVLADKKMRALGYRLRLARNEHLDAMGLVKRAATARTLASGTRVALDPWLCGLPDDVVAQAETHLQKFTGQSVNDDKSAGSGRAYTRFKFDGQLLLMGQLNSLIRSLDQPAKPHRPAPHLYGLLRDDVDALKDLRKWLDSVYKTHGEPQAYYALLMADGDGLGKALENVEGKAQDQAMTARLASFSANVPGIVGRHHGLCLYAGGDDVLAALPLDKMLACADDLRKAYAQAMNDQQGTLSVGLAIGHALEPLEDMRQWALAAEATAKNKRDLWAGGRGNALAIHWHVRSGVPRQLRSAWGTGCNLPERITQWVALLADGSLSNKSAFDLGALAQQYSHADGSLAWPDANTARAALRAQTLQLLKRKGYASKQEADPVQKALDAALSEHPEQPQRAVRHLAHEWQLAMAVAKAQQEAAGKQPANPQEPHA